MRTPEGHLSLLCAFCERQGIELKPTEIPENEAIVWIEERDPRKAAGIFVSALIRGKCPVPVAGQGVADPEFRREQCRAFAERAPQTPVFGCISSGSSGRRRLYLFDLDRAFLNARMHAASLEIESSFVIYQALPLSHLFGLICYLFTPALTGCTVEFQHDRLSWAFAEPLSSKRPLLHLVPAQLKILEQSEWSRSQPVITVGTDQAPKETLVRLGRQFSRIFITYGLTEAGPRVATGFWDEDKPEGWIGEIFNEIDVRYALNAGERESLLIRTPSAALNAELSREGYLDTRDVIQPLGRGGVFRRRLGHRFKWRGRLYSLEEMQSLTRHFSIRQRATLCVVEDSRLALFTSSPLHDGWREVFATLELPFPEHVLLEPSQNGKLDMVQALEVSRLADAETKLIYFG